VRSRALTNWGSHSIRKSRGEVAFEVIRHLGFDLHVAAHVETRASADTHEIDVRAGTAQIEVVRENSDFDVIFRVLRKHGRCCQQKA
jgi:hypothetical protein